MSAAEILVRRHTVGAVLAALLLAACSRAVVPPEKVAEWRASCRAADGLLWETLNPDGSVNRAHCVKVTRPGG